MSNFNATDRPERVPIGLTLRRFCFERKGEVSPTSRAPAALACGLAPPSPQPHRLAEAPCPLARSHGPAGLRESARPTGRRAVTTGIADAHAAPTGRARPGR